MRYTALNIFYFGLNHGLGSESVYYERAYGKLVGTEKCVAAKIGELAYVIKLNSQNYTPGAPQKA